MSRIKLSKGLIAFVKMYLSRTKRVKNAPTALPADPITEMAKAMHPDSLSLEITAVRENSATVRTYRLQPVKGAPGLPVFLPGQYISIKLNIGKSNISRAYTISSAPYEAEGENGFYEISVRKKEGGFASSFIWENFKPGTQINTTGPHGDFCYSPIRDTKDIVCIAGGCGITPFRSMIREFAHNNEDINLTLLYGCKDLQDVLFDDEINGIIAANPEKYRRYNTFEKVAPGEECRQGFLDAAFIKDCVKDPQDKTYFICGPTVMYRFLKEEFNKVGVAEIKQTRYEVSGPPEQVVQYKGFPEELEGRPVNLTVRIGNATETFQVKTTDTILVSIEKQGLILESRCRSGVCGICRSKLISGDVFILPDNDGRRAADKDAGYIHPCSTYPLSDCVVMIPPGKATQT